MTVAEQLYLEIQGLPESMQVEALRYVESLKQTLANKTKSIQNETPQQTLLNIMLDSQKQGTVFDDMDVLAWQKQQRQDKPLAHRDDVS